MMKLLFSALSKFLMGLLLVGALLFVPAGSLKYMNGWLFIGLLFVPMLILGSHWAFLCFALYLPIIIVRILNEEKVLEEGLSGYGEYKKRVKYRLFPFIW